MKMNILDYIKILRKAINNVNEVYFGSQAWIESMLNVHGIGDEDPRREQLIPYLTRHHERVFCYELYHQFRKIMEQNNLTNNVILQAELRKPQVGMEIEQLFRIQSTDAVYYPDFLIHEPGTFDHQDLIIEVKANPKVSREEMQNDLLKIDQFISKYQYQKGVFLAINVNDNKRDKLITSPEFLHFLENQIENKTKILLMFRESAKKPTILMNAAKLCKDNKQ